MQIQKRKILEKKNKKEIQTQQEEIHTEDYNLIWEGQFQWKLILTSLTQQII